MGMVCFGLILMVCQPQTAPQIDAARFCRTAEPMPWSRHDTRETQRWAKMHNAKGVKLCGWKRKAR